MNKTPEELLKEMPRIFSSDDCLDWLEWLADNGLAFHLDDDPYDCLRHLEGTDLLDEIDSQHTELWRVSPSGNPWLLFNNYHGENPRGEAIYNKMLNID